MMNEVISNLLGILKKIRKDNGAPLGVGDAPAIIYGLIAVMEMHVSAEDRQIYDEIRKVADKLKSAGNIELLPDEAPGEAILELEAVLKATEESADKIIDAVTELQQLASGIADKNLQEKANKSFNAILEACNFQDLTGQRINKVSSTLEDVEEFVEDVSQALDAKNGKHRVKKKKDARNNPELMNGPQMDKDAPSQGDVDKLFDSV